MNIPAINGTVFHHSVFHCTNGLVHKLIEPKYQFPPGKQEELRLDILEYRKRLQEIGVPVAGHYKLSICDDVLVEETENCGLDCYKAIRDGAHGLSAEVILRKVIQAFLPVVIQDEILVTPDPHPANWCIDASGVIRYIDFQPVMFKRGDLYLVGFPQAQGQDYEMSVRRYYSRIGLLRMMRFSAVRAGGKAMRTAFLPTLCELCPNGIFADIDREMNNLLEKKVRGGEISIEDALSSCDEQGVDDVREIAMSVAEGLREGGENFLNEVLRLTRADLMLTIFERRAKVEEAKRLIIATAI